MKTLKSFIVPLTGFILMLSLMMWFQSAVRAQEAPPAPGKPATLLNNDSLTGWTNAGLYGAHIYTAAFDPLHDVIFLSVAGGTYKSSNAGASWTLITQNGVHGLAVDPVNGTVYIGVVTFAPGPDAHQIWTSEDGGQSWVSHDVLGALPFSIGLDPNNGQVAFAGTNSFDHPQGGKVFRTLNGGDTWQGVSVDPGYCISSVAVDPRNANRVWAVSGACYGYPDHSAVYLSTDRGLTYNQQFYDSNGYEYTQVAFDPAGTLFLMGNGLRHSGDGGLTFSAEMGDETIPASDNLSLIFDPVSGRAYRSAVGNWYSDNHGDSWNPIDMPPFLAINPEDHDNILASRLPGLARSSDGGAHWQPANVGLEHVIVTHLDGPASENVLYASTHSGFGRSLDGAQTWDFPTNGGTYCLAVDPTTPGRVFTQEGPSTYTVSTDYGAHWTSQAIASVNSLVTSMAVDPADANILYAGNSTWPADPGGPATGSGLYASLNNGTTWDRVGLVDRQVYVIKAAAQPGGTLIYAGMNYDGSGHFDGGLYRSASGGSTWDLIGFSASVINDLAVDPSNPSRLLAAIGHWYPTLQTMGLYESRNKGDTWTKILFEPSNDIAANVVYFDPFDPAIIYVGAGTSLYRSRDAGTTWVQFEKTTNRDFHSLYIPFSEGEHLFAGTSEGAFHRPVGSHKTLQAASGGTFNFSDGLGFQAHILDDGGAVTAPTVLRYYDLTLQEQASQAGMTAIHAFQLYAYQGGARLAGFTFQEPITLTLDYLDIPGQAETNLRLLSWTGTSWEAAACGPIQHDLAANRLVVPVCHTGPFGLFVSLNNLYLPMARR